LLVILFLSNRAHRPIATPASCAADCLQTLWIVAGQVWGQQFRRSTISGETMIPTIRVCISIGP